MFLRIVLVLLVLSCSVGLAQAEWIEITRSSSDEVTIYADPTTYRFDKKSGLVKMWILYDFKKARTFNQPPRVSYLSARMQKQFDCKKDRYRLLATDYFVGNMLTEEIVDSFYTEENKWRPVARGTIAKTEWNVACGTAKP